MDMLHCTILPFKGVVVVAHAANHLCWCKYCSIRDMWKRNEECVFIYKYKYKHLQICVYAREIE